MGFVVGVAVGLTVGVAVGLAVCVEVGLTVGVGVEVGWEVGVGVAVAVGWTVGVGVAVASERGTSVAVTVALTTSVDRSDVDVEASVNEASGTNAMVANTRRMVTISFSLPFMRRLRASCHLWIGTTSNATSKDVNAAAEGKKAKKLRKKKSARIQRRIFLIGLFFFMA